MSLLINELEDICHTGNPLRKRRDLTRLQHSIWLIQIDQLLKETLRRDTEDSDI